MLSFRTHNCILEAVALWSDKPSTAMSLVLAVALRSFCLLFYLIKLEHTVICGACMRAVGLGSLGNGISCTNFIYAVVIVFGVSIIIIIEGLSLLQSIVE